MVKGEVKKKKKDLSPAQKKILEKLHCDDDLIEADPKRLAFAEAYLDPSSEIRGNALQCALRAGYSPSYANHILTRKPFWWCEIVRKTGRIDKIRQNLNKFLDIETKLPVIGAFGPVMLPTGQFNAKGKEIKEVLYGENDKLLRVQQDTTHFLAEKVDPELMKKTKEEEKSTNVVVVTQVVIKNPDGTEIKYDPNQNAIRVASHTEAS